MCVDSVSQKEKKTDDAPQLFATSVSHAFCYTRRVATEPRVWIVILLTRTCTSFDSALSPSFGISFVESQSDEFPRNNVWTLKMTICLCTRLGSCMNTAWAHPKHVSTVFANHGVQWHVIGYCTCLNSRDPREITGMFAYIAHLVCVTRFTWMFCGHTQGVERKSMQLLWGIKVQRTCALVGRNCGVKCFAYWCCSVWFSLRAIKLLYVFNGPRDSEYYIISLSRFLYL